MRKRSISIEGNHLKNRLLLIKMENNFKKVHIGKDLAISSIIFIAGVGLYFINKGASVCLATCGLLMLLLYKKGYKKDGQDIVFTRRADTICKYCRSSIIDFLNGKTTTPAIKKGHDGGCVYLEVYYNQGEKIAYAQLFDFCNYSYKPVTEIVELRGDKVDTLISIL